MFQSALHLCLSIPVVYFVDAILGFGPELDMPNSYIGSLSSMLMLALTVVELMDMLITPVPFRATYVIPATLYGMVVSLVTSTYTHLRASMFFDFFWVD